MVIQVILLAFFLLPAFTSTEGQRTGIRERCLTQNGFDDRYASYSPDGKWIVFESKRADKWDIFLMDAQGQNEERLTAGEGDHRRPSWHPNGKKILFETIGGGKNGLYLLRIRDGATRRISPRMVDGALLFASFSPRGNRIAASYRESDDRSNIILLNRKGRILSWLTQDDFNSFYPRWSPDGKEILYFSRKDTNDEIDEIYRLEVNMRTEIRLTDWPQHNFCPSWSPDRARIAYVTSMEDTRPEIYIMDANGRHPTRVTFNEDGDTLPNWHPRENKLLITAYRQGGFEVCELDLEE